jgi:hypothetical protein
MRSLANMLESAAKRGATEVMLESGQPVVFTTARGPEDGGETIARTDLFDMIVAAVDDAQQIELAVGNPVEFSLASGAADGSWRIYAEPGLDGVMVRALREGQLPTLEIELDVPTGLDVPPSLDVPTGFDIDALPDADEFEVDFEPSFGAADPGSRPASKLSRLDVQALDVPTVQDVDADFVAPPSEAPAAPHESGTWALVDEDDDFAGELGELGADSASAHARALDESDAPIGVPDDDDEVDDDPFDPFSDSGPAGVEPGHRAPVSPPMSPPNAPPVPGIEARKARPVPAGPPPGGGTPTRREVPVVPQAQQAETRRELPAQTPEADTQRELPSVNTGLAVHELAASIAEGSLVYVLGQRGLADTLAGSFAAPSVTLDDHTELDQAWAQIRELPVGALLIVRREDPSPALGGILRRLEQGYRVLLDTGARTPEGARRVLLGLDASARAEAWLDQQVNLVIEPGEAGPRVRRLL